MDSALFGPDYGSEEYVENFRNTWPDNDGGYKNNYRADLVDLNLNRKDLIRKLKATMHKQGTTLVNKLKNKNDNQVDWEAVKNLMDCLAKCLPVKSTFRNIQSNVSMKQFIFDYAHVLFSLTVESEDRDWKAIGKVSNCTAECISAQEDTKEPTDGNEKDSGNENRNLPLNTRND